MLIFTEGGKQEFENPEKNPLKQGRESTTNSTRRRCCLCSKHHYQGRIQEIQKEGAGKVSVKTRHVENL
jgi:hypothetical protein